MASSYSMKPNPFMSLISVILPVPCVLKWSSISCLVAKIGRRERVSLDQSSGATGDTAGPPSRYRKSRRIRQRLGYHNDRRKKVHGIHQSRRTITRKIAQVEAGT